MNVQFLHDRMVISTKRTVTEFTCEWLQFIPFVKWNWIAFTFFNFAFEYDKMCPGIEVCLGILGFTFRYRYNLLGAMKKFEEWDKDVKELVDNIF